MSTNDDAPACELSDTEKKIIEMLKQTNISGGAPLQVSRLNGTDGGGAGHPFWDTQVSLFFALKLRLCKYAMRFR